MPDFSPNIFIHRDEIIGDINTSSDRNTNPDAQTSLPDRNVPTNIVTKTFLYILEFLLMIILLPFSTCQKIYANDHLMVMLRVILEVSLELAMWLVLAGVSILTSAALIFDDLYSGKEGSEGYRRLVKKSTINPEKENRPQEEPASVIASDEKSTPGVKNECTEETGEEYSHHLHSNRERICYKSWELMPENPSRTESRYSEKDDDSVNFSFYKPLRYGLNATSSNIEKKRGNIPNKLTNE